MQLVFVHGVATRSNPNYLREERQRDMFFKEAAFAGSPVMIQNPKWGDLVGEPYWKNDSMPKYGNPATPFSLGQALGLSGAAAEGGVAPSKALPDLAKVSLEAAVDALVVNMVDKAVQADRDLTADELQFFVDTTRYLSTSPDTSWINSQMTDESFTLALQKKVQSNGSSAFGVGVVSFLKDAVSGVTNRARNLVGVGLTAAFRDDLNPLVGEFLGDVFAYLKDDSKRKDIRDCVRKALLKAHADKQAGEPVVVVGHSMGGVILIDMLSDPAEAELLADKIDLLVTVGSQPGFFEEHKLFVVSDRAIGKPDRAAFPAGIKDWWNVYDPVDILSFRCDSIFAGVEDFQFSSAVGLLDAHTAYFKRPKFFERLRKRAKGLGIIA
ncbi:hypothetical protein OVA03_07730 [Asticcacaulis sp. SL142]|uniref:hypothetical protein n=1 Tax=Asticcacaulis sp. SL142 TaxID=2995155 RepID=UPI00226D3A9A|nr:hypothetical protein [Asticcacaulis sp. SL142]WAC49779.1 hypothetical protein OVA03_07730 [Asticcacaulis sp. SL142]